MRGGSPSPITARWLHTTQIRSAGHLPIHPLGRIWSSEEEQ
jgi:hypothetical protein